MAYFDGIKVGDKVYSLIYGEGVVDKIRHGDYFAIQVLFDSGNLDSFSADGKLFSNSLIQDVYWQKPEINIIDKGRRLPDLPVDAKILVRNYDSDEWQKRHFSHRENSLVFCWTNGGTSFTEHSTLGWLQWKLPEDEV